MLTGVHFLTTLNCNFECDHCFLHSRPGAGATFTLEQIRSALDELVKVGSIQSVCFEGGEPLLYFPLVLAGMEEARARRFGVGLVTNGFWATSRQDARLWLEPLQRCGLTAVSVSDDPLHYGALPGAHVRFAAEAAEELGMTVKNLTAQPPTVHPPGADQPPGSPPRIAGGVMFRGRAAEKLTAGLPRRPWETLTTCPHEPLRDPRRVHVDALGNVHLCQGLSLGNFLRRPLSDLIRGYDPDAHPIVGPLVRGGPAELARAFSLPHADAYVDECHFCYRLRQVLRERFPEYLGPNQVYGLSP